MKRILVRDTWIITCKHLAQATAWQTEARYAPHHPLLCPRHLLRSREPVWHTVLPWVSLPVPNPFLKPWGLQTLCKDLLNKWMIQRHGTQYEGTILIQRDPSGPLLLESSLFYKKERAGFYFEDPQRQWQFPIGGLRCARLSRVWLFATPWTVAC